MEEVLYETWFEFKQNPTIETRNYILMNYLHLVKEIAGRIAPTYKNYIDYDDLYSCGIFGLMDAIEKFDVEKGIKFKTYATWRIRGSIIDQIREQDWLPKSLRQKFKSIEEAFKEIEKNTGKFPSDEEVANYLQISVKEVSKTMSEAYYYQVISIDEEIMDIANFNESSNPDMPESNFIKNEIKQTLTDTISKLTDNERMVTSLYYFDELNQKEIGKVMGLTESRISQLHSKALMKIRASIEKYKLIET